MTIIELPQGYWGNLTGVPKDKAVAAFENFDRDTLARRPHWHEFDAKDTYTAPWGYEAYTVDEADAPEPEKKRVRKPREIKTPRTVAEPF